MKIIYLILLCLFTFNYTSSCYEGNIKKPREIYHFVFTNDTIEINISVDNILINRSDTIKFLFEFINKSKNAILLFPSISYTYSTKDTNRNLFIEHGGLFSPGVESGYELKIIKPQANIKIELIINSAFFIENGFKDYFPITYSFGFIPNIELLFKNEYLGSIKTKYKSKNMIEASNIVIFSSLKIKTFLVFFAKLKNEK